MTRTTAGRALAGTLALNRTAFGVGFMADPRRMSSGWVGPRAARRKENQMFARVVGARDIALGVGTLTAAARGDMPSARGWLWAQTLSDGADAVATYISREDIPRPATAFALAMACGSVLVGLGASALMRDRPGENESWFRENEPEQVVPGGVPASVATSA